MFSNKEFEFRYGIKLDPSALGLVRDVPILPEVDRDPVQTLEVAREVLALYPVYRAMRAAQYQPREIAEMRRHLNRSYIKVLRPEERDFALGTAMSKPLDKSLEIATARASLERQTHVQPRHILLGLLRSPQSFLPSFIESFGTARMEVLIGKLKLHPETPDIF